MNADEPLALEPARGLSPLATQVLIGAVAFVAGVGGTAALIHVYGAPPPAPVVAPRPAGAPQAQPVTAPALPAGTDIATLNAREQALAARLDQLDTRLTDVDSGARAANSYATQAERLMIAFAARRAIERGMPLGPLEPQLRRRFGEAHGEAVATLIQAAGQPVTLEDLRLALDTIAPRLVIAPDEGFLSAFRRMLGDMVVLRQSESPSPRPADRLRRARRTLEEGQVEAALAEVARMPGVANAASWVTAARHYIAARAALREIEVAAMETPTAAPAPVAATTAAK